MRTLPICAIGLLLAFPVLAQAQGKEEQRTYRITADGKPAGSFKMIIEEKEDNIVTVRFAASVVVKHFLKEYKYNLKGYEVWQKDVLVRMETQTDDDGKKMQVRVDKQNDVLKFAIDGQRQELKGDIWTTTYWHYPAEGKRMLMDADTGKLLKSTWEKKRDIEELILIDQKVKCTHVSVTGAAKAELWFDGSDRLVKQEITESGVKMVTELIEFKK